MSCPICDQNPINCDCSPRERAMYQGLQEAEDRLTTLTLTDEEREAVQWYAGIEGAVRPAGARTTLRGLLERTLPQS